MRKDITDKIGVWVKSRKTLLSPKGTGELKMSKKQICDQLNALVDESRLNVFEWVRSTGVKQIEVILLMLDKQFPSFIDYTGQNFRWRITDSQSESTLCYKDVTYDIFKHSDRPDMKSVTGKLKVEFVITPEGRRYLKINVSGEGSYLRGYETLGDSRTSTPNKELHQSILDANYKSLYDIKPTSFYVNSDRHSFSFEVDIDG